MDIISTGVKPENIRSTELLCELLADGTDVKFNRCTEKDPVTNEVISVSNFNLDGTVYEVVDEANVSICPPPQIVEKTIGRERLSLTDAEAGNLTPVAGADFANITFKGCGYASDEGTAVLADGTIGHEFGNGGAVKVCGEDMADFSAIAATGQTLEVEVTYKQCVQKQ